MIPEKVHGRDAVVQRRPTSSLAALPTMLFTSGYSPGVMGEVVDAYGAVPFLGKRWSVEVLLVKVRDVLDGAT